MNTRLELEKKRAARQIEEKAKAHVEEAKIRAL
jgi:hypothetical protein